MRKLIILFPLLIIGCANPLNRVTSDNYAESCEVFERQGDIQAAEQACYRALVNVDMGNLGAQLKSERLYNLARIKRKVAKFNEAEDLLIESIKIEKELTGPTSIKSGRRLAELSTNLAAQNKWEAGIPAVKQLSSIANKFTGNERNFVKVILIKYGEHTKQSGDISTSEMFTEIANEL